MLLQYRIDRITWYDDPKRGEIPGNFYIDKMLLVRMFGKDRLLFQE